jgi:hypothetical protein
MGKMSKEAVKLAVHRSRTESNWPTHVGANLPVGRNWVFNSVQKIFSSEEVYVATA